MRKFKLVRMIIWAVVAVALTLFLISCIESGFSGYFTSNLWKDDNMQVIQEETFEVSGLNLLNIDCPSANVYVARTYEADIRVIYKIVGNHNPETDLLRLQNDAAKNTLNIEQPNYKGSLKIFGQAPLKEKIEIYIPETYESNLQIRASSGMVKFADNATFDQVNVEQSDGSLEAEDLKANIFSYFNTKGTVTMNALNCDTYTIRMGSGDLDISQLDGAGEISTHEGDINLGLNMVIAPTYISATSGDIKIELTTLVQVAITAQSGSYSPTANFKLEYTDERQRSATANIGMDPRAELSLKTNTGKIEIHQ